MISTCPKGSYVCRCQLYFRDGRIEMPPKLSGFWRLPRIAYNQLATSTRTKALLELN
ncbi:hypothetical protein V8C42DRAFT_308154 [Trichoderma barbatum]